MKQETQHNFYHALRQFDQIPETEFPAALHGRIMRTLYLRQFKLPLVLINAILFVNLSISGFHLWHMSQAGFAEAYRTLAERNVSEGLFASAAQALAVLPIETSAVFFANLALMAAGVYLLHRLRMLMLMARRPAK